MRRQRRTHQTDDMNTDDYQPAGFKYQSLLRESNEMDDFLQMERLPSSVNASKTHRFENTIEAKVEVGDTLQALALRFHCTVADIKRLNKIDKENEIHARKVVKIPVTVHSVLLETMPTVHKSGNNSPRSLSQSEAVEAGSNIMRNPLEDARAVLSEKLMVASVNASGNSDGDNGSNINLMQHSKVTARNTVYTDEDHRAAVTDGDVAAPLLSSILDDEVETQRRPIRGPPLRTIDWPGSDCDMSWACLFVVILALCFAIPLIIVIFFTHPHSTASH